MTRAEIWVQFASGALADTRITELSAASVADRMLQLFEQRFTFVGNDWLMRDSSLKESLPSSRSNG